MRFSKVLFITIVSLGLLSSCSKVEKSSTAIVVQEEESLSPEADAAPLSLTLSSKYEGASDASKYLEQVCALKSTDPEGTHMDCNVEIPELRLHYSDLIFNIKSLPETNCKVVKFQPYYFLRSKANATLPEGTTATDCTKLDLAKCFGGAAKSIVDNAGAGSFPYIRGLYFLKINQSQETYTATAASTLVQEADADSGYRENINYTNNMPLADRGNPVSAGNVVYDGNGTVPYQDYYIACQDLHAKTLYSITLTISDKDTPTVEGPPNDEYYDWD